MAAVTFLNPGLRDKVRITVPEGVHATVLKLAKEFDLPLRCKCEEGNCGVCAVKVVPLRSHAESRAVHMEQKEKTLLLQAGKLSREQFENDTLTDMPPLWRLACQYQIEDEDILVAF
jgi:ferredoxin